MKLQETVLGGLGCRYYTPANKVLRGSEANRKLDIFLTHADTALPNGEHNWSNVLVIGEHKPNPDEDTSSKTTIQLAGYAREVFGSQPDRRFVRNFTICGCSTGLGHTIPRSSTFTRSQSGSSRSLLATR